MEKYCFKITLSKTDNEIDIPSLADPLTFKARSHDNIIELVKRLGIKEDEELSFFLGIKLFGEGLLRRKNDPSCQEIMPVFKKFMQQLKSSRKHG